MAMMERVLKVGSSRLMIFLLEGVNVDVFISKCFKFVCKDNANRVQNHQACLSVMPRCSLSYAKIYNIFHIYGIYARIFNDNYTNQAGQRDRYIDSLTIYR